MFGIAVFEVIYLLIALAGIAVFFWFAITAIRAMNVYIAKNQVPSTQDADYGARL